MGRALQRGTDVCGSWGQGGGGAPRHRRVPRQRLDRVGSAVWPMPCNDATESRLSASLVLGHAVAGTLFCVRGPGDLRRCSLSAVRGFGGGKPPKALVVDAEAMHHQKMARQRQGVSRALCRLCRRDWEALQRCPWCLSTDASVPQKWCRHRDGKLCSAREQCTKAQSRAKPAWA